MTDSFEEFSEVAVPADGKEIALAFDRERYDRDCPRATGSGSSSSRYFTKYLKEMCKSVFRRLDRSEFLYLKQS